MSLLRQAPQLALAAPSIAAHEGVVSQHFAPFRKGCPQESLVSVLSEVHSNLRRNELLLVRRRSNMAASSRVADDLV